MSARTLTFFDPVVKVLSNVNVTYPLASNEATVETTTPSINSLKFCTSLESIELICLRANFVN